MDGSMVHYAVGKARPGDVVVIDRCVDETIATLGGAVAYAAKKAGVAGIIVDGLVTGLGELRQHDVPVWFKGTSAVNVKTLGLGGEFCVPVTCSSAAVHPGDAVLADEAGITGYKAVYWMGLLAPGKTPQPIIEKLNAEVRKILATSSVRKQIEEISLYPGGGTPEEFGDLIRSESAIYARLIEDLDIPRQ